VLTLPLPESVEAGRDGRPCKLGAARFAGERAHLVLAA
jgi:hypothetical protein